MPNINQIRKYLWYTRAQLVNLNPGSKKSCIFGDTLVLGYLRASILHKGDIVITHTLWKCDTPIPPNQCPIQFSILLKNIIEFKPQEGLAGLLPAKPSFGMTVKMI